MLRNVLSRIQITNFKPSATQIFSRFQQTGQATSEKIITTLLKERFPKAKAIEVKDTSGGCGQMFSIYVESEDFNNISVLKQHKLVYQTLNDQIKLIHGLHLITKAS